MKNISLDFRVIINDRNIVLMPNIVDDILPDLPESSDILKIVRFTCLTNNGIVPLLRILIYSDLSLWLNYCINASNCINLFTILFKTDLETGNENVQTNKTSMIRRVSI